MALNKVMLIGNLGQAPELKYLESGKAVLNLSLATNKKWTDGEGAKQERTEWHRLVLFGKLAETCAQYLGVGSKVFVEGELQTRTYDKDGETRYSTEIVVNSVQFLDSKEAQVSDRDESPRQAPAVGGRDKGGKAPAKGAPRRDERAPF